MHAILVAAAFLSSTAPAPRPAAPEAKPVLERTVLPLDPARLPGHNDLGSLRLGHAHPRQAAAELATLLEPAQVAAAVEVNLTISLLALQRNVEAERVARRALANAAACPKLSLLLGLSLVGQRQFSRETIECLRRAQAKYPEVGLRLADALLHRGAVEEARRELRCYLLLPEARQKEVARSWLALLPEAPGWHGSE